MLLESGVLTGHPALLPQTPLFDPPPSLLTLFAERPSERFAAGSTLFWQGDAAADFFEIAEGALRMVRVLDDGRRAIAGFWFAGDLVGASAGEQYYCSAEAIVLTRVRRCSRRRFETQICGSPDLHREFLGQLRREITACREHLVLLALKTAEERVSSFLLSMLRRGSGSASPAAVLHLPMPRVDIADYLGLTIETVSRTMTRLRDLGVIVQTRRHTIIVRQPRRLAVLAAADDNHLDDEQLLLCAS
jgi:CRP/FNR family transcriptional regulator